MVGIAFSVGLLILAWAGLRLEYEWMARMRATLPLRVGVTGTRGKSSVTRLIAAGLRGNGRRVVAKTTGSRPVLIGAEGTETPILRTAPANILEQRKLLRLAGRENAEGFVAEIMSVHRENQAVESGGILDLRICVITNVRMDHVAEQGGTRAEVALSLAASIPEGGVVVCAEGEDLPELRACASQKKARFLVAPSRLPDGLKSAVPRLGYLEFEENLSLAATVCAELGVPPEEALRAMGGLTPDLGALRLWRLEREDGRTILFANAFAANDPESSLAVIRKLRAELPAVDQYASACVLNLRADRPERTAQWIRLFGDGSLSRFGSVFVTGPGASAAAKKMARTGTVAIPGRAAVPRIIAHRGKDAKVLLDAVSEEQAGDIFMIGLGNIAGLGGSIAGHFSRKGVAHEL